MNPVRAIAALFRELLAAPPDDLLLRLTLLTLLLHGSTTAWLEVPFQIFCGLMLLSRNAIRDPVLWMLVTALCWWVNARDWLWIDNHKYLMTYWTLVCTLATLSGDRIASVMAWNARVLVGLTFLCATVWKLAAGQYFDGSFMHYTLLTDGRFEFFAHVIGGVAKPELNQAPLIEEGVALLAGTGAEAAIYTSPRLEALSLALSWFTLAIEAAIALAFFMHSRWRDALLLTFIVATYFFVPVLGFGYILAVLGLAACPVERPFWRAGYLVSLVVLQIGRLPWETVAF